MDPPPATIDRLYRWLGLFTNLYLAAITFEFFSNLHRTHPAFESLLDSFSEPYLGALAVYVVLKEIRKRRAAESVPFHRGEWFVYAWLSLFVVTTLAVAFTERYGFDLVYRLIIANSLASLMIYIGARLNRPQS